MAVPTVSPSQPTDKTANIEPWSVSSLSDAVASSVATFEATGAEADRLHAAEQATRLTRALEKPGEAVYKLFFSLGVPMAIKIASDMGLFAILATAKPFVTWKELAAPENADRMLVERIMRVLVSNGFASELGPGKYIPTPLSVQMTDRTSIALANYIFVDCLPVLHKTPDFLRETAYQNPNDTRNGPAQYALNTSMTCWDWFAANPPAFQRFNTFMEGGRASLAHWADWFPVGERLLQGAARDGSPFLVDVGGGRGHELAGFKQRYPDIPGQLVLEDLPPVIDDIRSLDPSIKSVKHNFFERQPIKGARAYYFKFIMHDWPDENCRTILRQTKAAMKKGYSKILIEDYIVADQNPSHRHTSTDMLIMVFCPGTERTQSMWTELLNSVGLNSHTFWAPEGDGPGIIEVDLPDVEEGRSTKL